MAWWAWIVSGLALLTIELFLPADFYFLFIGAAAISTGLLVGLGFLTAYSAQWTACGVLTLAFLLFLRRELLHRLHADAAPIRKELEGELVLITHDIEPGETGKGQARGSVWTIRNDSSEPLLAGKRYAASGRDGLVLVVRHELAERSAQGDGSPSDFDT